MTVAQTHRKIVCRKCGAKHTGMTAVDVEEEAIAAEGDTALCIECAAVNIITDVELCRQPTADEYDELLGDKWFVRGLLSLTMHLNPEVT